ncbi:PREDICTED: retinol-binding protein 2-like [Branchiostoma belcheri]|uniref:Retinol-binding protein 2-like n=1 Tax=Branchiostoma belcheri TaxID=7741 RepID=A0A6P4Y4Y8_BRABE|nr:PREDICTED: retinol-binding protein 2-like [Branchiostoma belcheri]KAI8522046.1 DNA-binding protein jumonji/rbp2/SMCY [Branchiostoma belcheri]
MSRPDLNGTWNQVKNENFDAYMRALDVGFATRKIGNMLSPQKVISQDGDHMNIKTLSTFKNHEIDFNLGQEFEEHTLDGRTVKTTITWDGEKLCADQKGEKSDRGWCHTLVDGKLHLDLHVGDVRCHQEFKKES